MNIKKVVHKWIFPSFFTLFILECIILPSMLGMTQCTNKGIPEHILTYTTGRLIWDINTKIDSSGSAKLSLFENNYGILEGTDSVPIILPGMDNKCFVHLNNSTKNDVNYTAVLCERKSENLIYLKTRMNCSNSVDTNDYKLPDTASDCKVIKAVTGTLCGKEIQNFDIECFWDYQGKSEEEIEESITTDLDSISVLNPGESIFVGLYITIEDNGKTVFPQTGDTMSVYSVYTILIVFSFLALGVLWIILRRKKSDEID